MKKIITICAAILMTASLWAQSPEKMSYQAVVRDGNNALVTSTALGMQISILQGSANGTAVYVETQTTTSNANGLVSIEIGSGTVVSGTFASIDWANGPYFIKTETDPTGGTSYTITGVSQLLSVPYALHAKSAETVSGGITEADPVYTGSQAANITATDITNLGNLSGTNTGDQDLSTLATKTALGDSTAQVRSEIPDVSSFLTSETDPVFGAWDKDYADLINTPAAADGSETKLTAGTNVTITGAGTTASPYVINASSGSSSHYVGELYGGGVVFWVDQTGQHGLIVSMIDLSTSQAWSNVCCTLIGATAQSDWDGLSNSNAIVGQATHTSSAAKLCLDYTNDDYGTGTYSDWYLPSRSELNDLWNSLKAVQKALDSDGNATTTAMGKNVYWSSSELIPTSAWNFGFNDGDAKSGSFKSTPYYVRAVRAF